MSLNTVRMGPDGRSPLLLIGEVQLFADDVRFEMEFGNGYPSSGSLFSRGRVTLTNYRIIFVPVRQSAKFSSFNLPLFLMVRIRHACRLVVLPLYPF